MINREGGSWCEEAGEWCTHSVRKANVAVGMVRAAAVDLVRIAGLLHHHRAGLHRFWSAGQHGEHTFSVRWKTPLTGQHRVLVFCRAGWGSVCQCNQERSRETVGGDAEVYWSQYGTMPYSKTVSNFHPALYSQSESVLFTLNISFIIRLSGQLSRYSLWELTEGKLVVKF